MGKGGLAYPVAWFADVQVESKMEDWLVEQAFESLVEMAVWPTVVGVLR